jgi:uncharacterized membrane protein YfhO
VPLARGVNRVTLAYTPPGLHVGLAVSGAALVAAAWLAAGRRDTPRD